MRKSRVTPRRKGLFISIEGGDGCGKSTHTRLVARELKSLGYSVVHSREPGGVPVSEKIRSLLLHPGNRMLPLTELLLYEAARWQHTNEKIIPALLAGRIVMCERYTDASLVYQGYGRKMPIRLVRELNRIATGGLKPDITLVFDGDYKTGLKRARALNKLGKGVRGGDRLEREGLDFHRRISEGYRKLAAAEPGRVKLIDVTGRTVSENFKKIIGQVLRTLKEKKCLPPSSATKS